MEDPIPGRGQACSRAGNHVHQPDVRRTTEVLAGCRRREVGVTVQVEVPPGERRAEAVTGLTDLGDAVDTLPPQIVPTGSQAFSGCVKDADSTKAILAGNTDRQVLVAVAVEVRVDRERDAGVDVERLACFAAIIVADTHQRTARSR